MSYFLYGSENSLDYALTIEEYPEYNIAERVIERYKVPGRSGDLIFDTGSYSNVKQKYKVYIKAQPLNTHQAARLAAKWLQSPGGYRRLEDSYDPEIYRMAMFTGPVDVSNWFAKYGRAELEFDCRPQRFLKSGEYPLTVENQGHLYNPGMEAAPLIFITGSGAGSITLGDYNVQISSIPPDGIYLDCDTQNACSGTENKNNQIALSNGFPILIPGDTKIGWSGGITGVQITPRWWIL